MMRWHRSAPTKALRSLLLLFATAANPSAAADNFSPTRDAAGALGQSISTMPQFVLLSFDGAITPQVYDLYRPLADYRSPIDGCPLKPTWYVNVAQVPGGTPSTKCDIVSGLRRSGHEIATRTYAQTTKPTKEEIESAVDWLNATCGVPREEMRGFRTPQLSFNQTTFDNLAELGFTYDSSIADAEVGSSGGTKNLWPYTMDDGIAQDCVASAGSCNQTKSNPGLWEVPLWRMRDEEGNLMIPVDWFDEDGIIGTLERNFANKYNTTSGGNKAPLAINVKASWLAENMGNLTEWINTTLSTYDDVFFVTTHELLEWMRNPVTASSYKSLREDTICADLVTDCFIPPPPLGCGHGTFDSDKCECTCPHPWGGENCLTKISDFWTPAPTPVPTASPSVSPSAVPTSSPSAKPSDGPTTSHAPTSSTKEPTSSPTSSPTVSPTVSPTTASPVTSAPVDGQGTQAAGATTQSSPAAPFAAGGITIVARTVLCSAIVALLGTAVVAM